MHDALAVGRGQRVGQREPDVEHLRDRKAAGGNLSIEAGAGDELHGEEPDALVLLDRVEDDDVGMGERRHRARFALEAGDQPGIARDAVGQHLDRDLAVEPGVASAIDLAHTAGAEWLEDLVGSETGAGGERHPRTLTHHLS